MKKFIQSLFFVGGVFSVAFLTSCAKDTTKDKVHNDVDEAVKDKAKVATDADKKL